MYAPGSPDLAGDNVLAGGEDALLMRSEISQRHLHVVGGGVRTRLSVCRALNRRPLHRLLKNSRGSTKEYMKG